MSAAIRALRTLRDRRLVRLPLYEDITPSANWTDGVNCSNLIIDIPGFKNGEVNMEIDEYGNVSIKGKHDVGNNRFRRFSMTVKAPEKTDMKRIVGSVEGGLYTVVFPKMDVLETMMEGTEAEKKQLEADELDEKIDKGKEAALDTEPSNVMEKAAIVTDERVPVTEAASVMETMLKKIEDTSMSEVKKETMTQDENATNEPEIATKSLETSADHQEPPETSALKAETDTKPTEAAALGVLETSAMALENPTTKMGTASALPETDEAPEPKTGPTMQKKMVKLAIKNEEQEHQELKKDGRFLENVMEMITEHRACIVSAILAFSLGILISRRIRS